MSTSGNTRTTLISPFQYFADPTKARPVFNGFIYIGRVNGDPTNPDDQIPIQLICECGGTPINVTQPVRTGPGGLPIYNGQPAQIVVCQSRYSITVQDKDMVQVEYSPDVTSGFLNQPITHITIDDAISDNNSALDSIRLQTRGGVLYRKAIDQNEYNSFPSGNAPDNNPTSRFTDAGGTLWVIDVRGYVSAEMFGAVSGASDVNNDDVFDDISSLMRRRRVDLTGGNYRVTLAPTEAYYYNGSFTQTSTEDWVSDVIEAPVNEFSIAAEADTGGRDQPFSGGARPVRTVGGRTNNQLRGNIACQNCRAQFPRAVNIASIFSWAYGNVSGNYSARQSIAGAPQSANIASEECEIYGFRGVNLGAVFSETQSSTGGNLNTRLCSASGTYATNIASNTCRAGAGRGARLTPVVQNGVVVSVTIINGGSGYDPTNDTIRIIDRSSVSDGNAAVTFSVDGSGTITSVAVTNGGSGYLDDETRTVCTVVSSGDQIAIMASLLSNINNSENSSIIASRASELTEGMQSFIAGSNSVNVNSSRSAAIACSGGMISNSGSVIISGNNSNITNQECVVIGRRVDTETDRTFVYGDSPSGSASTTNRKFQVNPNGNVQIAGSISSDVNFSDYAELFENFELGKIDLGNIVTLEGDKIRKSVTGDSVLGVISATACVIAGNNCFHWSGRYLKGDFGEPVYEQIDDPDWKEFIEDPNWKPFPDYLHNRPVIKNPEPRKKITVKKENPDFDPDRDNIQRTERLDEWSVVGLLGQVYVRVDSSVLPGDYLVPSDKPGIGKKSDEKSTIKCMKITKKYSDSSKYGVAFCFIYPCV